KRFRPEALPEALQKWLCDRYGLEAKPMRDTADLEKQLWAVADKLHGGRLLLFVDALDEAGDTTDPARADDPARAVKWIPHRHLPRGVFFVVTSRPSAARVDHLRPLLQEEGEWVK